MGCTASKPIHSDPRCPGTDQVSPQYKAAKRFRASSVWQCAPNYRAAQQYGKEETLSQHRMEKRFSWEGCADEFSITTFEQLAARGIISRDSL